MIIKDTFEKQYRSLVRRVGLLERRVGRGGSTTNQFVPTELNTEDLNTITTSGVYYQETTADATLARNYPTPWAGLLYVNSYGADFVHQTYHTLGAGGAPNAKFWRAYYVAGGWTPWERAATVDTSDTGVLTSFSDVFEPGSVGPDFSFTSMSVARKNGWVGGTATFTYTGSTFSFPSTGNTSDIKIADLQPGWRPISAEARLLTRDGIRSHFCRIRPGGDVHLTHGIPDNVVNNGTDFYFSFGWWADSTPRGTSPGGGSDWTTGAVPGWETVISGCVVRFDAPDGSPSLHANASHVAAGVTAVDIVASGRLRLTQTVDNPTQTPILFAVAQPDETLVQRGISFGLSGGTGTTEYVVYDSTIGRKLDLNNASDLMRLQGANSNAWFGFVHAPGWWTTH